jgi:hypothetical protein
MTDEHICAVAFPPPTIMILDISERRMDLSPKLIWEELIWRYFLIRVGGKTDFMPVKSVEIPNFRNF